MEMESLDELRLPDGYYDQYAGRVKALTSSDVKDAAQSVIVPDHVMWLVQKDMQALNLGEIRSIDADGQPVGKSQSP